MYSAADEEWTKSVRAYEKVFIHLHSCLFDRKLMMIMMISSKNYEQ